MQSERPNNGISGRRCAPPLMPSVRKFYLMEYSRQVTHLAGIFM
jgi:hypothetical protein